MLNNMQKKKNNINNIYVYYIFINKLLYNF